MEKAEALIIEDDADLVLSLRELVDNLGYVPAEANQGTRGLEMALSGKYAFILLDINLPMMEGTEVCRKIREQDKTTPIIVITSNNDETHTVLLLELGADDYVTKPFRVLELKARIKSAIRRVGGVAVNKQDQGSVTFGAMHIDYAKRRVLKNDEIVMLTAMEFDILAMLAAKPGTPVTRDSLLEFLYGNVVSNYDKGLSTHIARIRSKIEDDPQNPQYLITARGVGYYFSDSFN